MATHQFQVRLQGTTNLPSDVYENVLYFDVNAPDTVEGRCQDLAELYDLQSYLTGFNMIEVRAYVLGGGQPVASYELPTSNHLAPPAFHEVALCLSYATVDDPENSTPRRRGRIYLGPIGVSSEQGRPSGALRGQVLDFGEALAQIGSAGNTTWQLFSRTDQSAHTIESIWVDNAWDTQRRRGLDPTVRDTRDVQ